MTCALTFKQIILTLAKRILGGQVDLGPYCSQYRLPKRMKEHMTNTMNAYQTATLGAG